MTHDELIRWWRLPTEVSIIPHSAFGDCIRDLTYWYRSTAEFGIPTTLHFADDQYAPIYAKFFMPLVKQISPDAAISIRYDTFYNPPPWVDQRALKSMGVSYRSLPSGQPMQPGKLSVHRKPVDEQYYREKTRNTSNRFYSDLLFRDILSEFAPHFSNVQTVGAPTDCKVDGLPHIIFRDIEHAIAEITSSQLLLCEISFPHALATRCNAPHFTVVKQDTDMCCLCDTAGTVHNLHSRNVVLAEEDTPALSGTYAEHRNLLRPKLAREAQTFLTELFNRTPEFERRVCYPPSILETLSQHVANHVFTRLEWAFQTPPLGRSTLVCQDSDTSTEFIQLAICYLLAYNDLIEHVNELCKRYRRIYFWDPDRLRSKRHDLYIQSNDPGASGAFRYNLRYDKMMSSVHPSVRYIRLSENLAV